MRHLLVILHKYINVDKLAFTKTTKKISKLLLVMSANKASATSIETSKVTSTVTPNVIQIGTANVTSIETSKVIQIRAANVTSIGTSKVTPIVTKCKHQDDLYLYQADVIQQT